jgi:hypothetical protein
MALVLDPIYIVNLSLCIIILILGIFGYRKKSLIRAGMVGITSLNANSAAELVNLLAKRELVFLRVPTTQLDLLKTSGDN